MTDELGDETRRFITTALREDHGPPAAELARVRRRVLAFTAGTGALVSAGTASALGSKLVFGVGVGVVVKAGAIGVALGLALPVVAPVFSDPPEPKAHTVVAKLSTRSVTVLKPTTELLPEQHAATDVTPPVIAQATSAPYAVAPQSRDATRPMPERSRVPSGSAPRAATQHDAPRTAGKDGPPLVHTESVRIPTALSEELAVLRRVNAALRAGDGAGALAALDASAALDGGALHPERLAAEVLAACQAGQLQRARRAAERLLRHHASTPAAERVRSSCVREP